MGRGIIALAAKVLGCDIRGEAIIVYIAHHILKPVVFRRELCPFLVADGNIMQNVKKQRQDLHPVARLLLHPTLVELGKQPRGNGRSIEILGGEL